MSENLKCTRKEEVNSVTEMHTGEMPSGCDRRKRKSCDTEDSEVEIKRVRTNSEPSENEASSVHLNGQKIGSGSRVPQNGFTSCDQNGPSSPTDPSSCVADQIFPDQISSEDQNSTECGVSSPDVIQEASPDGSPKSEDSLSSNNSSGNTTSGVDVEQYCHTGPGSSNSSPEKMEIVNISEFVRFEPRDPSTLRPLKSALKRPGKSRTTDKSIKFDVVREFRFNRIQSFVTMPSKGGMSLGMEKTHHGGRELVLDRYRIERDRSRRRKMRRWRKKQQIDVVTNSSSESGSDSDDDQGHDYLSLHPVPPERRRRMLQRSGYVIENDSVLADHNIRLNREHCGCTCQGICYPETCACYTNGIGCQVDRLSFPCGCQRDQCWNPNGRTSFNVERVKNHFYRTMERLRDPHATNETLPPIGAEVKNSQNFSFGDFTLPPNRDPPPRDQYHAWNHESMSYWNDGSAWTWASGHINHIQSHAHTGMHLQNDLAYNQNSFYSNDYTDMSHSVVMGNPVMGGINPNGFVNQNNEGATSICNLRNSLDNNEERLSESSESGIGEENTESSSTNSSPNVPTFQMCGSIETSMTVAYTDDSNNSLPVPVGSE